MEVVEGGLDGIPLGTSSLKRLLVGPVEFCPHPVGGSSGLLADFLRQIREFGHRLPDRLDGRGRLPLLGIHSL